MRRRYVGPGGIVGFFRFLVLFPSIQATTGHKLSWDEGWALYAVCSVVCGAVAARIVYVDTRDLRDEKALEHVHITLFACSVGFLCISGMVAIQHVDSESSAAFDAKLAAPSSSSSSSAYTQVFTDSDLKDACLNAKAAGSAIIAVHTCEAAVAFKAEGDRDDPDDDTKPVAEQTATPPASATSSSVAPDDGPK